MTNQKIVLFLYVLQLYTENFIKHLNAGCNADRNAKCHFGLVQNPRLVQ